MLHAKPQHAVIVISRVVLLYGLALHLRSLSTQCRKQGQTFTSLTSSIAETKCTDSDTGSALCVDENGRKWSTDVCLLGPKSRIESPDTGAALLWSMVTFPAGSYPDSWSLAWVGVKQDDKHPINKHSEVREAS